MTLAMGTLHAWSVFSADLESTLDFSRALSSLVYSLTLVTLTLTVLLAVPLFKKFSPTVIFSCSTIGAGLGLLCASQGSAWQLFLGYSGIFGIANGVGYGFALQLSAKVFPLRSGFAMGITTAAYALGATVGAQILGSLIEAVGSLYTLRFHGVSFLLLAPVLALLIHTSKAQYAEITKKISTPTINHALVNRYRLSYGLAVFAGLMAIAHAAPFINSFDGAPLTLALWGAIVLGVGNATGGLIAGVACDRFNVRKILMTLPCVAAVALAISAFSPDPHVALLALVLIGFTYGALIAVYPVAIARQFGPVASAAAYGRIFIAWGLAGLLAPVTAGLLFDVTHSYRYSLLLAMLLSLASAVTVTRLNNSNTP